MTAERLTLRAFTTLVCRISSRGQVKAKGNCIYIAHFM